MNTAHASHTDSPAAGVASWYTPGRSDGFGDRLLMFDNTDAISLELLRFRRELASIPGFENGLRDHVDAVARLRHAAFPVVRAVVYLDEENLTLVSAHTPGQRLSELPTWQLHKGLHPAVVTWIVREITPALTALQGAGPGVSHGALSADRIVLTGDGRLCIIEHVLAPSIRRLGLLATEFWTRFGLLAPTDERGLVRIDQRTDVVQLGAMALSLLLARPVTLADFEHRLPALLDEFSALADISPSVFAAPLRAWLERALQLAAHSYRSAAEAQEGIHELPVPAGPPAELGPGGLQSHGMAAEIEGATALPVPKTNPKEPLHLPNVRAFPTPASVAPAASTAAPAAPSETAAPLPAQTAPVKPRWKMGVTAVILVTLVVVAIAESAIIAKLSNQIPVINLTGPFRAALAPLPEPATSTVPAEVPVPAVGPVRDTVRDTAASALADASARQRSGGVRLSSHIPLNVLEGDRVLGSTADGPIVTTAGTHELELVNAPLGYRARQTVVIKAGVITPVTLPPPMGRININAQPWAQVLIDDNPIGETPLANVSVPLGQHEIVFRHPDLGERRETVTVRADIVGRVTTVFER